MLEVARTSSREKVVVVVVVVVVVAVVVLLLLLLLLLLHCPPRLSPVLLPPPTHWGGGGGTVISDLETIYTPIFHLLCNSTWHTSPYFIFIWFGKCFRECSQALETSDQKQLSFLFCQGAGAKFVPSHPWVKPKVQLNSIPAQGLTHARRAKIRISLARP